LERVGEEEMSKNTGDVRLFDICIYGLASTIGLRYEPKDYGPVRLLEMVKRISAYCAEAYGDDFLRDVANEIDAYYALVMSAPDEFYRLSDVLLEKLVQERKARGH